MSEQNKAADHVIQGFNPALLFGKGLGMGSVDLIQGGSLREAVGRSVSALLLHMGDKGGRSAFPRATIVLPPTTASKHAEESVGAALALAVKELRGFELDEQEESAVS